MGYVGINAKYFTLQQGIKGWLNGTDDELREGEVLWTYPVRFMDNIGPKLYLERLI